MATNGNNKRSSNKGRFNDVRFVQYELSAAETAHNKEIGSDWDTLDDWLLKLAHAGYRVSVKFDAYSKAYAAFIQTFDEKSDHYNCILPGRGSSPLKAIRQACYKHFVVFDCQWGTWLEARGSTEIDD